MPRQVCMHTGRFVLHTLRKYTTHNWCTQGSRLQEVHKACLDLCMQAVLSWHVCCSGKVEDSIRMGGLAEIKTERIKAILATLKQEQGSISLEYIREMDDEELKAELTR